MKQKFNRYQLAYGAICGLIAGVAAFVFSGAFNPILAIFIIAFFLVGKEKYGEKNISDTSGLKGLLVVSVIWPYLAWKKLDQSLQTPSAITYNAYVNHVFVGTLSDTDHSAIMRQVLRDPRIYIAQLMNVGRIVITLLNLFIESVPILAFWSFLGLAYFEPEMFNTVLTVIQQGPVAIRETIEKYFSLLIMLWMMTMMVIAMISIRTVGFQNKFYEAYTRLLRQKLQVAAEGNVFLESNLMVAVQKQI